MSLPGTLQEYLAARDQELFEILKGLWRRARSVHDCQNNPNGNENGYNHVKAVEQNIYQLLQHTTVPNKPNSLDKFKPLELFLLSCSACCHDFDKALSLPAGFEHGQCSGDFVLKNMHKLELTRPQARAIQAVISLHDLKEKDFRNAAARLRKRSTMQGVEYNLQRLAVLLKAGDILHCDNSRIPEIRIDLNMLTGIEKKKYLFRYYTNGWLADGARITLEVDPDTEEAVEAIHDCFTFMKENEWHAVSEMLEQYGLPYVLALDLDEVPARKKEESLSKKSSGIIDNSSDNKNAEIALSNGSPKTVRRIEKQDSKDTISSGRSSMHGNQDSKVLSSVYVSYAWVPEKEKQIVQRLEEACNNRGIILHRDKNNIFYGESIREYMRELGAGQFVIVVLSEEYLQSKNCMYELLEIEKNKKIHQRVFPIVLENTKIYDAIDKIRYLKFWENKANELKHGMSQIEPTHIVSIQKELNLYADIRRSIDELMDIIGDMNALTENVHLQTNFEVLIDSILAGINTSYFAQNNSNGILAKQAKKAHSHEICNEIQKELDRPVMAHFCKIFLEKIKAECGRSTRSDQIKWLCDEPVDISIDLFHEATRECLEEIEKDDFSDDQIEKFKLGAENILGWLVLHAVDDLWLSKTFDELKHGNGMVEFEVPLEIEANLEVVTARLNMVRAQFQFNVETKSIIGKNCMPNILEAGAHKIAQVVDIEKALYKQVCQETIRGDFGPLHLEELDRTIQKRRKRRVSNIYISIPKASTSHPLNIKDILDKLKRDLPNLGLVFFGSTSDENVLVLSEADLVVLIREFFLMLRG